jgi:NADH-quinone oxidoreductase subunit L
MTVPLMILALLSLVAGKLFTVNHAFLNLVSFGGTEYAGEEGNKVVMSVSLFVALLGIGLASLIYYFKVIPSSLFRERFASIHKVLINKYYIDEFYDAALVKPAMKLAGLMAVFDQKVIDRAVNMSGWLTVLSSKILNVFMDHAVIDGLVNGTGWAARKSGDILKRLQTGLAQNYLLIIIAGLIATAVFMVIF